MRLKDFNETFLEELQDTEFAAAYLQSALEEGCLPRALQNVVKANGGMTWLAKETALGRESLYKSLAEQSNPEFKTVESVLSALGLRLEITPKGATDTAA